MNTADIARDDFRERRLARIPLKEIGAPEDLVGAVVVPRVDGRSAPGDGRHGVHRWWPDDLGCLGVEDLRPRGEKVGVRAAWAWTRWGHAGPFREDARCPPVFDASGGARGRVLWGPRPGGLRPLPTWNIRLSHVLSGSSEFHLMAERFRHLMLERTEGRLRVTIYPSGQLGGERRRLRADPGRAPCTWPSRARPCSPAGSPRGRCSISRSSSRPGSTGSR